MTLVHHLAHMLSLHTFEGGYIVVVVDGILEGADEFVVVPRFGDEVGGTCLQSFHCKTDIGKGCH